MDSGNVSAIISATAGIVGVILGNSFVAIKEYVAGRRTRKSETVYLGILIASHLERFADGCLSVAMDDGTDRGRPAGSKGIHAPIRPIPEFSPLTISVNWKLLPTDLLYQILKLPDRQEGIQGWLEGISEYDDDFPERTEYFWVRRKEYAELGLQAEILARKLRTHCGIPNDTHEPKNQGDLSRTQMLKNIVEDINERRSTFERRQSNL